MVKAVNTWEIEKSWESGWLAGLFDGEGHLSLLGDAENPHRGVQLGFSQKEGPVLAGVKKALTARKFDWHQTADRRGAEMIYVRGGRDEIFRFLGETQPLRLLNGLQEKVQQLGTRLMPVEVESISPMGKADVVSIETDTRTFIAEGFAVHNCYPGAFGLPSDRSFASALTPLLRSRWAGKDILPTIQTYSPPDVDVLSEVDCLTYIYATGAIAGANTYTLGHATDEQWAAWLLFKPGPQSVPLPPDIAAALIAIREAWVVQWTAIANHGNFAEAAALVAYWAKLVGG
jgi:hypothetical protein